MTDSTLQVHDFVAKKRPVRPLDLYGAVKSIEGKTAVVMWYRNGEFTTSREFIANLIVMKNSGDFILDLKRRFEFTKRLYFAGEQTSLDDCATTHQDWVRAVQVKYPNFKRRLYQSM